MDKGSAASWCCSVFINCLDNCAVDSMLTNVNIFGVGIHICILIRIGIHVGIRRIHIRIGTTATVPNSSP